MAKAKTTKIPKRIAGVKLPKDLRKAGNALIEQAQSPQGRQMMVGALAMAANAATAAMARSQAPRPPETSRTPETPTPGATAAPPQGTTTAPDAKAIADALTNAAELALGRLFGARKA